MIGWITPEDLIEAASSSSAVRSKTFLGWFGFTSICSIGTSTRDSASLGSEASSAPSPRPSPRLIIMVQNLPSQFEVCRRATGPEIVHHDRPAVAGSFRESDVAWDDGVEHLPWKVPIDLVADLEREARSTVEHREQDPQEVETGIQLLSNELHGLLEQMGQSLERVELALQRDEHSIRRDERVDRQQTQRRRAIDDDVVIGGRDCFERVPKSMLASLYSDELDLGSHQVDVRRQQTKAGYDGRPDCLLRRLPTQQHVIDRGVETALLDPQPGRRIALRIQVHEERRALGESEPSREIDGGRRLSYAALLIHDRESLGHLGRLASAAVFHDAHYPINICLLSRLCSTSNTFHSLVCSVKFSVNSCWRQVSAAGGGPGCSIPGDSTI